MDVSGTTDWISLGKSFCLTAGPGSVGLLFEHDKTIKSKQCYITILFSLPTKCHVLQTSVIKCVQPILWLFITLAIEYITTLITLLTGGTLKHQNPHYLCQNGISTREMWKADGGSVSQALVDIA